MPPHEEVRLSEDAVQCSMVSEAGLEGQHLVGPLLDMPFLKVPPDEEVRLSEDARTKLSKWSGTSEGYNHRCKHVPRTELLTDNCLCFELGTHTSDPAYTHLGSASSFPELRAHFLNQLKGNAEELQLCQHGLDHPNAVILTEVFRVDWKPPECTKFERLDPQDRIKRLEGEQVRVVALARAGHKAECTSRVVALAVVYWAAISQEDARAGYDELTRGNVLSSFVMDNRDNSRRNSDKGKVRTCRCNGDPNVQAEGRSYTMGCTWSERTRGCKWGETASHPPKSFYPQTLEKKAEQARGHEIESQVRAATFLLADKVTPAFKAVTPKAWSNMVACDNWSSCRIGNNKPRPFGSASLVCDYAAHPHTDRRNMEQGATVALTLRKPGTEEGPPSQVHVFTDYTSQKGSGKGNMSIELLSGTILIEVALHLRHSTTPVSNPSAELPSRIGVILVQHHALEVPLHGQRLEYCDDPALRQRLLALGWND